MSNPVRAIRQNFNFNAKGTAYAAPGVQLQLQDDRKSATIGVEFHNFGNGIQGLGHTIKKSPDLIVKLQDSDDGQNWNDVANTEVTVAPRGIQRVSAVVRNHLRVMAYGNTEGTMILDADASTDWVVV